MRQMLAAALHAEVAAYIDQFTDQVDEDGRRLVVRNGYHRVRDVLTAAGAVTVAAPRVNDRRVDADTRERQRFSSAILPAWARRSPQMNEVLPLLYLHGLSTGDWSPSCVPARSSTRASSLNDPSTSRPTHQTPSRKTRDRRSPDIADPPSMTINSEFGRTKNSICIPELF